MKLRYDRRYLIAILLVLAALALMAVIGNEIGWGQRISLQPPKSKPQQSKVVLAPLRPEFGLPPLEQTYTEVLARPLFVPGRRPPPPPPPVVPPKPAMRKGQFMLVGVILTKDKNVALLREIATGKVSRVERGKEINGILVASMEKERVVLKQWDDQEELVLKFQPMPKMLPTAQAMPPPMAPPQTGIPGMAPPGAPPGTPIKPQDVIAQRRALHGLPP